MSTDDESRNILIAKIISGSGLFVASVLCGIIPFKLAKVFKWTEPLDKNGEKKTNMTVNVLLSFGGGVLLATTFLHLLPEINHTIKWLVGEGMIPEFGFSLGELLMMIGFFLIYLIEELVHNYLHRHQHKLKKEQEQRMDAEKPSEIGDAFMRGISARNSAVMRLSHSDFNKERNANEFISTDQLNSIAISEKNHSGHGHGHSHLPVPHSDEEDTLVSSLRGLLIVLALSIHELFEGFAVGLEKDATGVYFMFAAVSAHKFVIAFCIGVELMVQRTKLWLAFVYVLIYSAVSAIGKLIQACT